MPALPSVSKVIRLDYQFQLYGSVPALSRQFYHYSGTAPTLTDMQTFVANAVAGFAGNCLGDLTTEKTFVAVEGTDLSSPTAAQATETSGVGGTNPGNELPQDIAFVLEYQIARRYRGGHPRGYWPFGSENEQLDPISWQTTPVNQWVTDLAALQTAVIGGGWGSAGTIKQVAVSYFHGFTVVTSPTTGRARNVPTLRGVPVQDDVVQYIGRLLYGNQRRRLGR